MCRYRYSCQRSRIIRRPLINSKSHRLTHEFLDEIKLIFHHVSRSLIMNMDETNVGQMDSHVQVIGHSNTVGRKIRSMYNAKTLLTTCLTICADGHHLPPFYIKKGKTTRCLASLNINGAVEAGKHPAFTLALCRLVDFTRFGASLAVIVFLAVFVGSLMFDFALVLQLLSVTTDGRQPRQWCDT
jgi:hypothetical protein